MKKLMAFTLAALVSACGGDGDGRALDAIETAAAAPQRMRALAVPVGADARLNADRLMDYAEAQYKDLFPVAATTRSLDGWVYRYYPQTGVYLAVINWRIFVVGGPIGPEARDVGQVSDYITITPPSNLAPTVSLTLALKAASPTSTVILTADAADGDGTVAKVEFFNGTTKLGETQAAPHVLTLAGLPAGLYELTAKATDNAGSTATTPVSRLRLDSSTTTPVETPITVASLAKCSTALGTSAANSYTCMVGATPTGTLSGTTAQSCSMTVSSAGVVTVKAADQQYSVDVPALTSSERNFTKTSGGLSFDYGPTTPTGAALRLRGRTVDNVLGQFFQQGGSLAIDIKRAAPEPDLTCTIPLAMS